MLTRRHLYFSGLVQGVGFRFTVRSLAKRYRLKGWVKNIPDGRVEAEIEGDTGRINEFMDDLKREFSYNIKEAKQEKLSTLARYEDFQIIL